MVERRVVFPVIGDDEALQKDTRVIFTNQQLLTRNPSLQDEASIENNKPKTDAKRPESFKPYKAKTSFSTQHRPLNSNHDGVSSYDKMPKVLFERLDLRHFYRIDCIQYSLSVLV